MYATRPAGYLRALRSMAALRIAGKGILLAFVALSLVALPVNAAPLLAQVETWTATLTVGVTGSGDNGEGFCATGTGPTNCPFGSLDDNSFDLLTVTYTVKSIRWGDFTGSGTTTDPYSALHLTLDADLPAAAGIGLTLQIGDEEFALTDSSFFDPDDDGGGQTDHNYRWQSANVPAAVRDLADGDTVEVKILFDADANNQPGFRNRPSAFNVPENTATNTNIDDPFEVSDLDADDTLTFSLTNTNSGSGDAEVFAIDSSTGQLKTKDALDHENQDTYAVTVNVSDSLNDAGVADTVIDDSFNLTINVTDVNEPGAVMLLGTPEVGETLTAELVEQDEPENIAWQWARASSATGTFTNITGETSETHTLVDDDEDQYLRATATYDDTHATDVTVSATSGQIGLANDPPVFNSGLDNGITVDENTATNTDIGNPFTATDPNGDTLTYTLTGSGASSFAIDSSTGQIKTKDALDHETTPTYAVIVNVRDSKDSTGAADTAADITKPLSIIVRNVDEAGTVSISGTLSGGEGLTASVTDLDGTVSNLSWRWARASTATGTFTNITSGGTSATYTTVAADVGKYLKATATYRDPQSTTTNKSANAVTSSAIGASNAEPTFSSMTATRTLPENSGAEVNVVGGAVTATDTDTSDTLTYSLVGTDAGSFEVTSGGQIKTKTGVTHNFNFEAMKNSYSVTVRVRDSKDAAGNTDTGIDDSITVTINLTNVNEAPTITTSATTRNVAENSTAVLPFAASDVDASDTKTWSVESADDGGFFQINSSTGVLTFKTAPDFEDKQDAGGDNTYDVTVKVADAGGLFDTHDLDVTVTDVNETPTITSTATMHTAPSFAENGTGPVATYTATDPDATTGTLTWSVEGNDRALFNINPSTGVLTFKIPPDFEDEQDTGTDNVYDITVKVQDNGNPRLEDTQTVAVTVTDVNETPVVIGNGTPSFAEIEFDVVAADLTAADLTIPGTYTFSDDDGDDVTWSLSGGDANHFTITEDASGNGVLTFKNPSPGTNPPLKPANFEAPVDTGSGNNYEIVVEADDGQGVNSSVGTYTVTVTVNNVDETPEITAGGATHSFEEIEYDVPDADLTPADYFVSTYTARDEEDGVVAITWNLAGDDAGDFTIEKNTTTGAGVLAFRNRPNYEIPVDAGTDNVYNIIVRATDTTSKVREYPVTVTVNDVNERPDINEDTVQNYMEIEYDFMGTPGDVHTFTAEDYDDMDTFTWSLSGTDAEHLEIDMTSGVLTFKQAPDSGPLPDFENPRDADADGTNTYNVTVIATDNHAKAEEYPVTVTVTPVDETPELTGTITEVVGLNEHNANEETYVTKTVASYTARDEESTTIYWSLTGTDAGDFAIDSSGAVTFAATPNYEEAKDSDGDSVYNFTVVAGDAPLGQSRLTDEVAVTITVRDVEELGSFVVSNVNPGVGDRITFTLSDPDGGISLDTGEFSLVLRAQDAMGIWQPIPTFFSGTTTLTYTVDEDDTGKPLRADASYFDRRSPVGPGRVLGARKYVESEATAAVTADPSPNVPPRFIDTSLTIAEGPAGVVGVLEATDRDGDRLTFAIVERGESDLFEVNASTGQVRATQALDFETAPNGGLLVLNVTLHDGKEVVNGVVVADDKIDATTTASIVVTDVEEPGVVTLSAEEPEVGVELIATLTDGDGSIRDASWQWARSENPTSGFVNIFGATSSGATSSRYTPDDADGDFYLRASVTYADRRSAPTSTDDKSAEAVASPVPSENRRPSFPDTETGQRTVPENTRANTNIGVPVAATDPERNRLTYSLAGTDFAAFTIVTSNGQLRTSEALDFETKRTYSVTVEVHDGRDGSDMPSTSVDDTQAVTITIENVEEPGTVTLSTDTGTIQARVEVTAELSDDDRPTGVTWQWWRSPSGRTLWVEIQGATNPTYTPTLEEDAGNYIRATASYTDGHEPSLTDTAHGVSPRVGQPPPINSAPVFPATSAQREVAEDATGGTAIGDLVAATDLNAGDPDVNDPLAYSLTGTDAASFTIDADTGQLRLAQNVALDYEGKRTHRFTVQVTDGRNQNGDPDEVIDATRNVTVTVTNVNEAPVVSGEETPSFTENDDSAVATYTGADPERDTLTWSVSGNNFVITDRGQLYFASPPSFEDRTTYQVTVTATDDDEGGNLSGSLTVTVTVTDVEEEGVVTITPPRGWVDARTRFTAALDDDDGGITGTTWRWARSSNGRSGWGDITGADSSSYTAGADDLNQYLRATASYTDARGSNKTAEAVLTAPVGDVKPEANTTPTFTDTSPVARTVPKGTAAGRTVGRPVRATDTDQGEVLTYSLQSGQDAGLFTIDAATGQLRTKNVLLDIPDEPYTVTIDVHDGFDDSYNPSTSPDATIEVTITVTAAPRVVRPPSRPTGNGGGGGGGGGSFGNQAPAFGGARTTRSAPENTGPGENIGAPVVAGDPDGDTLTYALGGADAASFYIVARSGQLQTKAALDYETQGIYTVTVEVRDGKNSSGSADDARDDVITVIITVTDVDEDGTVTLPAADFTVGTAVAAALADPDGGVSGVTWLWERSTNQTAWTTISGAVSASYVPVAADAGNYLRVTASYTDANGADKSAQAVTGSPVAAVVAPPTPEPTPTAAPTPEPTAMPTPDPTATPTPEPTATLEPTATPVPTTSITPEPEPTATPESTATATPVPTSTPTPMPPPIPTVTPADLGDGGGVPLWVWVLPVIVIALVVGSVVYARGRR